MEIGSGCDGKILVGFGNWNFVKCENLCLWKWDCMFIYFEQIRLWFVRALEFAECLDNGKREMQGFLRRCRTEDGIWDLTHFFASL